MHLAVVSAFFSGETMEIVMRPRDLLIRCLAEFDGQQWTAISLEFGLAAQADTFEQVKQSLDAQIQSYLHDAVNGEDRVHARYLLNRRAPVAAFLKYYIACATCYVGKRVSDRQVRTRRLFTETLRVQFA